MSLPNTIITKHMTKGMKNAQITRLGQSQDGSRWRCRGKNT